MLTWFNDSKAFGFIAPDGGGENRLAHFSAIGMQGFKRFKEGQKVSFDVRGNRRPYSRRLAVRGSPRSSVRAANSRQSLARTFGTGSWHAQSP